MVAYPGPSLNTPKRRRAAMQSALFNARANRLARIAANSAPSGPVFTATWHSIYSKGNRLATSINGNGNGLITAVAPVSMPTEYTPFSQAFDKAVSSGGPYYGGGTLTAGVSSFVWQFDAAIALCGLAFVPGDIGADYGMWDVQGSNDGASWTTLTLTPFHWENTSTGWIDGTSPGYNVQFANIVAYSHYRMLYRSGTFSGNRMCIEIFFKVMAHPMVELLRTAATVTSGGTQMAVFNRPIHELIDGILQQDYPSNAPDQVRFTGPSAGDYLRFDFGSGNNVSIKRFMFDTDGQFNDGGTWKWQVSTDGVTWKDSGSSFDWNSHGNNSDLLFPGGNQADKGRYWQLVSVTPNNSMNGLYEITFDFYDE